MFSLPSLSLSHLENLRLPQKTLRHTLSHTHTHTRRSGGGKRGICVTLGAPLERQWRNGEDIHWEKGEERLVNCLFWLARLWHLWNAACLKLFQLALHARFICSAHWLLVYTTILSLKSASAALDLWNASMYLWHAGWFCCLHRPENELYLVLLSLVWACRSAGEIGSEQTRSN